MNIYLDNIIYSNVTNGGVSNYWFELTKYIQNRNTDNVYFLEDDKARENFHRKMLTIDEEQLIHLKSSLLSRIRPINHEIKEDKAIYHSSYYRALKSTKEIIEVTTIHDFIHNFYSPLHKKIIHNKIKYDSIKRSQGIICVSENTYSDLKKFCPITKKQKAEVIYIGVSDDYFPISEFSADENQFLSNYKILGRKYILFVGNRTNYKNFNYVANLLKLDKELILVTIGGGNFTPKELKSLQTVDFNQIVHIKSIENKYLNVLYNGAQALLYPSEYEGFGIPVIEAMRSGCPVIGYNQPVIREVGGTAAILFDTLNEANFKKAMENLANDDFKTALLEKGFEQSKKYSWEKCSRETHEFYSQLYDSSFL